MLLMKIVLFSCVVWFGVFVGLLVGFVCLFVLGFLFLFYFVKLLGGCLVWFVVVRGCFWFGGVCFLLLLCWVCLVVWVFFVCLGIYF